MHKSILTVGLAAVAANALLVIPGSSQADSDIINALPFEAHLESQSRSLDVACPSCPLITNSPNGRAAATLDVPNHLQLNFNIDHSGSTDRLLLNGFELYPNPIWAGPLKAVQLQDEPTVSESSESSGIEGMIRDLGYSLAVRPVGGAEDRSAELLEVSLRIVEIGTTVVDRVPTIVARVIKLADGALMIATVETQEPPAPLSNTPSKCSTTFCRLQELISQHLAALRGKISKHCGGGKKPSPQPTHPHRPGHHGPGTNGYGRKHHSWRHLLRNVVSHIVLPVLIGVVAGVSASIIGMLIGTFAVCLWRVVVLKRSAFPCRRGCRRSIHRHAARSEAGVDDEKADLITDGQELPPAYIDEENTDQPKQTSV